MGFLVQLSDLAHESWCEFKLHVSMGHIDGLAAIEPRLPDVGKQVFD